jgi:hypothetical protein
MKVQITADVPDSRQVTITLPPEVPTGKAVFEVSTPESEVYHVVMTGPRTTRVTSKPWRVRFAPEHLRNLEAFLRLLPELLQTQLGRYVAIRDGQLVETGATLKEVALRAMQRFGPGLMYFDRVTPDEVHEGTSVTDREIATASS